MSAAPTRTPSDVGPLAKGLRRRLATFEPDTGAPDWVPAVLLQRMVALPTARRAWQKGVGRSAQRALLIRAGAGRRREYDASSQTARALAALLRREALLWDVALQATVEHYDERRHVLADEALVKLAADPAAFADAHPDCPGELVVTVAYALRAADEEGLARLAEAVARRLHDTPQPDEDAERHRIEGLEDLVETLTKDLKERERRLRAADREAQHLRSALEELKGAAQRAGEADELLATTRAKVAEDAQTIAALRGELAASRTDAERLAHAEARAADAGALRADVEELRAERDLERELRREAQAETERVAEQLAARARRPADPSGPLPVESPSALFAALTPALGQAVALAGARIGEGRLQPEDQRLLRLAAVFAELAEAPAAGEAPARPRQATRRARAHGRAHPFTVRALGGAEEVGGSAFLIQTDTGHSVLLDAGQRVKGEYGDPNAQPFHFRVPTDRLAAVLVTHAHIDHVGSLPTVLAAVEAATDLEVPVWMSAPTRRLAEIMLADSARIQRAREERLGVLALGDTDFPQDSMRAAYTRREAEEALERVRPAQRGAKFRIDDTGLLVRCLPVAHVLGSCAFHLTEEESGATLLYTGDLGPVADPQATLPHWGFDELEPADVVIMESTYGAADAALAEGRRSLHGRERAVQLLTDAAVKTVGEGGFVLLPSFSLGRAQELVTIIDGRRGREMPDAPLYLAGMGNQVMDVYDEFSRARTGGWSAVGAFPPVRNASEWLRPDGTFDDAVDEIVGGEEPGYVIASPALLSGGWSRAFLRRIARDPRSGVVLTGHIPRGPGAIPNLNRLRTGDQLRLGDEVCAIECLWERISLSAHAPTLDLHAFAERMTRGRERTAFGLVHGDPAAQRELAGWIGETLRDQGATAHSLQRQTPWSPDTGA
ncbi:MAG TPA: MBL fold metallo-hydrolase [Solirubrobacter sp.]|nr:MBL fold metallo-hydrolase [Solirubrobacter sp.]